MPLCLHKFCVRVYVMFVYRSIIYFNDQLIKSVKHINAILCFIYSISRRLVCSCCWSIIRIHSKELSILIGFYRQTIRSFILEFVKVCKLRSLNGSTIWFCNRLKQLDDALSFSFKSFCPSTIIKWSLKNELNYKLCLL